MGSLIFGGVSGCLTTAGLLRRTARISSCCGEPRLISPCLMLPPSKSKDIADKGVVMLNNLYSLAHNKVGRIGGGGLVAADDDTYKVVGSSHGYVALYNVRSHELFLWNPVSRERIDLPSIHTSLTPVTGYASCVTKVIVSDPDCNLVIMSYGPEQRLAFWCPGRTDEWTPIGEWYHIDDDGKKLKKFARVYEDFAYSIRHNRLFCITQYSCAERWDLEDLNSPRIDCSNSPKEYHCSFSTKYVVVEERSNQVFVVKLNFVEKDRIGGQYAFETVGFDVYKIVEEELEEGGRKVLKMPNVEGSLGGLVLFVGINHSFALPVADYPELIPDSIYFTASHSDAYDIGIFDYKNETFSPCLYPLTEPPYEEISITRWVKGNRKITRPSGPFWFFTPTTTTTTRSTTVIN